VVDSLPADYYDGWIYPTTIALIQAHELPEQLQQGPPPDLCRKRRRYKAEEAASVIAAIELP
jgi:hypothetical protein